MEWRAATVVGAIPLGPSRERRAQLSHHAKAGTIAVYFGFCVYRTTAYRHWTWRVLLRRCTFGGFPPPPAPGAVLAAPCSRALSGPTSVLQSEEEEGAALMSVCSWVTDLLRPRRAQAAFGVTLPIKAELASTQISNVHLVLYGDGEPGALKVICFENARRAIVEREVAAQKLAHDHENVLTLLRDEIVPTGARSTLHTHTMHACIYAACTVTEPVPYLRRYTHSQRRRAGAAPALSVLRRRHVGGGAGAAPRRPRRGGGALASNGSNPHAKLPARTLTPQR